MRPLVRSEWITVICGGCRWNYALIAIYGAAIAYASTVGYPIPLYNTTIPRPLDRNYKLLLCKNLMIPL